MRDKAKFDLVADYMNKYFRADLDKPYTKHIFWMDKGFTQEQAIEINTVKDALDRVRGRLKEEVNDKYGTDCPFVQVLAERDMQVSIDSGDFLEMICTVCSDYTNFCTGVPVSFNAISEYILKKHEREFKAMKERLIEWLKEVDHKEALEQDEEIRQYTSMGR